MNLVTDDHVSAPSILVSQPERPILQAQFAPLYLPTREAAGVEGVLRKGRGRQEHGRAALAWTHVDEEGASGRHLVTEAAGNALLLLDRGVSKLVGSRHAEGAPLGRCPVPNREGGDGGGQDRRRGPEEPRC